MTRASFRSFLHTPRGQVTAALAMGVAGLWLVAVTAGSVGGLSSPIVVAGCLLGAALWPLVVAAAGLPPRAGRRPTAETVLAVLAFVLTLVVLPGAAAGSLPALLEPIPAGRYTYGETRDPGVALGKVALGSSFVVPAVVVVFRRRPLEAVPAATPPRRRRLGAAAGVVGLALLAGSLLVVRTSKARDEAGIRRAFDTVLDGLWSGPPAAVAPLLTSPTGAPDAAALATIECLRGLGPRRPVVDGIDRFVGRGETSAVVTAPLGHDGASVEVDLTRSGGGGGAPWRATRVVVWSCDPG